MGTKELYTAIVASAANRNEPGWLEEDTAMRLAFADLLEEEGDVDRSSFIRCQIALAELDHKHGLGWHCKSDECCKLEKKNHELLFKNRNHMLWAHPANHLWANETEGTIDWKYHRGFVEEVTLHLDMWMGMCRSCGGRVWGPEDDAEAALDCDGHGPFKCLECHGTGKAPLIGEQLVNELPLTMVGINNKRPTHAAAYQKGAWWWVPVITTYQTYELPFWLCERSGWKSTFHGGLMVYEFPTREKANEALSELLLKEARGKNNER